MPDSDPITKSVVTRGREIYERDLRAKLEAQHAGQFAAIDPETRDYAVAPDELSAVRMLREKRPGVRAYLVRIGARATYRLGGRFRVRATP